MTDRPMNDGSMTDGPADRSEEAALARLTAADPTRGGAEPDLTALRTEVLAAAASAGEPARRRSMLLAAGAAASVAVLAGAVVGGVVFGRATAPEVTVVASAPVVAADAGMIPVVGGGQPGAQGMPQGTAGEGRSAAGAPAVAGPESAISAAADAKMSPWWGYGGSQVFAAGSDVSADGAGTATGYLVSAAGVDRTALAQQLAEEFGIPGAPVVDEFGNVTVGPLDGSGPTLYVGADALASWSYYNPKIDPWTSCAVDPIVAEPQSNDTGSAADEASATSEPAPAVASCADVPMPDSDRSERRARALLAGLGVATDAVAWDVAVSEPTLTVVANQLLDGMRTSLTWQLTFADQGLMSAYGTAAGVTEYSGYPVVSPREAIERSNEPQWRAFGPSMIWDGGGAVPVEARSGAAAAEATPAPAPLRDGRPVVKVLTSTITLSGGEAGLAQYWQPDGTILLLPAYTFTDQADGRWSVIAVADSAVEFAAE